MILCLTDLLILCKNIFSISYMWPLSNVMFHVSRVTCHLSYISLKKKEKEKKKYVLLDGGWFDISRATLSSLPYKRGCWTHEGPEVIILNKITFSGGIVNNCTKCIDERHIFLPVLFKCTSNVPPLEPFESWAATCCNVKFFWHLCPPYPWTSC